MAIRKLDSGDDPQTQLRKCLEQAQTWRNRAAMAWQMRNLDLSEQALKRMWEYQVAAANIEGKEPPEKPPDPETYFEDWGNGDEPPWRPYDPSRVPKKPLPNSGSGAVALPLPPENEEG